MMWLPCPGRLPQSKYVTTSDDGNVCKQKLGPIFKRFVVLCLQSGLTLYRVFCCRAWRQCTGRAGGDIGLGMFNYAIVCCVSCNSRRKCQLWCQEGGQLHCHKYTHLNSTKTVSQIVINSSYFTPFWASSGRCKMWCMCLFI